jgi:hypothetical protein
MTSTRLSHHGLSFTIILWSSLVHARGSYTLSLPLSQLRVDAEILKSPLPAPCVLRRLPTGISPISLWGNLRARVTVDPLDRKIAEFAPSPNAIRRER